MIKKQNGLYPCPKCGMYPKYIYAENHTYIDCGCRTLSRDTAKQAEKDWNKMCERSLELDQKGYERIVNERYGIYDGRATFKIKPIDFINGITFENIPKLSADLPFGYSATVRPFIEDGIISRHRWFIQQKISKVIEGVSDTSEQAVKECQEAWIDIVRQALL